MEEFNAKEYSTTDLTNRTAVITGGAGVLCGLFTKFLANLGANVAILDLNEKSALKIVEEIKSWGGHAIAIKTNVLNRDNIQNAMEIVKKTFGSCDILINGAGGNHPNGTTAKEMLLRSDLFIKDPISTFLTLDPESIQFVFNLNFLSTFLVSQVFTPMLLESDMATIINISSMNAFRPLTKIPAYSAAKAAVSNFTQWLAVHLAQVNIRVNAIAPGFFLTTQNASLLKKNDGSNTDRAEKILAHTPLQKFGDPHDLLGTLNWLVNQKASGFVTGIVVPVDGGFSAYSGV